jgi:D-alanyl-D-alanine dipeptidase
MKKTLLVLFMTLVTLQAQFPGTKQLIIVTTEDWSTSEGTLQRYEHQNGSWIKVGKEQSILLGRNGLGWGIGLHKTPKDAKFIKKEGDGKAPAGIFTLKQAFGYFPYKVDYPYEVYTRTDHCVDDVHSKLYNKIVDSTQVDVDYKSKEHMRFPKNYYKYGVVVNHNHIDEKGAVKGAGSCIFLHIKTVSTAGCTVMSEAEMKELIKWLDDKSNPLLIQGTKGIINNLLEQVQVSI